MSGVSVASEENLSDLSASLGSCQGEAESSFAETSLEFDRVREAAEANRTEAERQLEEALEQVAAAEAELADLESAMSCADEDDPGPSPAELAAAREELAEARAFLRASEERLQDAVELLRAADENREAFFLAGRTSLARIGELSAECAVRTARAREHLERYLAAHPDSPAAAFRAWSRWTPEEGKIVDPKTLASRLDFSGEQLREAVSYFSERDPKFRERIESYRTRYQAADGPLEKGAVLKDASIHGSGDLAERLVGMAFRPLGEVSVQDRTVFEDGRYTKTDLFVRDLKAPVLLGRGERAFAPAGGSLALEIKAGHAPYLLSQKEHLVFQAGGHRTAQASATICTADIHDLSEEDEKALREAVRAAGSPMLGMLPRKDEIDQALFDAIAGGVEAKA